MSRSILLHYFFFHLWQLDHNLWYCLHHKRCIFSLPFSPQKPFPINSACSLSFSVEAKHSLTLSICTECGYLLPELGPPEDTLLLCRWSIILTQMCSFHVKAAEGGRGGTKNTKRFYWQTKSDLKKLHREHTWVFNTLKRDYARGAVYRHEADFICNYCISSERSAMSWGCAKQTLFWMRFMCTRGSVPLSKDNLTSSIKSLKPDTL